MTSDLLLLLQHINFSSEKKNYFNIFNARCMINALLLSAVNISHHSLMSFFRLYVSKLSLFLGLPFIPNSEWQINTSINKCRNEEGNFSVLSVNH